MSKTNEEKIEVLLISDIHESKENVIKLQEQCLKNNIKPDYIFCLGDNVTIKQGKQKDKDIIAQKEKEISELFSILETICPNLIYLPGNHDPDSLFQENPPKLTEKSINLHLKTHEIKSGLIVAGLGGSICNLKSDETLYHKFDTVKETDIFWMGYPYIDNETHPNFGKSDELMNNDLMKLGELIKQSNSEIILMTHNGPYTSSTANPKDEGTVVYGGSKKLNKFIYDNEKSIICSLHGHTHEGPGVNIIHTTYCANPGCLKLGMYGFLKLEKNAKTNYKWKIKEFKHQRLD